MVIPFNVLQVNYSDNQGGAGRAAYRIHRALINSHVNSSMFVNQVVTDDYTVYSATSFIDKTRLAIHQRLSGRLARLLVTKNSVLHSPAIFSSGLTEKINQLDSDVVHLHWLHREMLSIKDIISIRKPVVWTLHDMWAFCGAEHYTTDFRWSDGYHRHNRPVGDGGFDLNRWTFERKKRYWRKPFHIVCPSQWLADCVRNSYLMHDWPISVVPNAIDTNFWQPFDQGFCRQLFNLPQDCPLLLFGSLGTLDNPRKGGHLLMKALHILSKNRKLDDLQLVVFGQRAPKSPVSMGFPVNYIGHLSDDITLRLLYSASDLVVTPSLQDNLPNIGLEAHACGSPVVAFNVGGFSDIVVDGVTGALAQPFVAESLADRIQWVLEDSSRLRALGTAARQRSLALWSQERVVQLYKIVYLSAIELYESRARKT